MDRQQQVRRERCSLHYRHRCAEDFRRSVMDIGGVYCHCMPAFSREMQPTLAVVVDTEEEFDWQAPISRANRSVKTVVEQAPAQEIYDEFEVVPTYVADYPVVTDPKAIDYLNGLKVDGRCMIGAHLHTWVNPPFEEEVTSLNSFQCNLPVALEHAKIEILTHAVSEAFGERPKTFKAGRYGFGQNTASLLLNAGYQIDCSFVPYTNYRGYGGASFIGAPRSPFWLDKESRLLEIPVTKGFVGRLAIAGKFCESIFDQKWFNHFRVSGILSRTNMLERSHLSPEGMSSHEIIRLIRTLLGAGEHVFTLTYHSTSLAPGNTPYVRDKDDLHTFLTTIRDVISFFKNEVEGQFVTLDSLHQIASGMHKK